MTLWDLGLYGSNNIYNQGKSLCEKDDYSTIIDFGNEKENKRGSVFTFSAYPLWKIKMISRQC